jgi:hypothetical protein
MIDDVDYLLQNAEKNSQILYIDSGLRDKITYPQPNDYTIEFDQPFKFVYGFDILDATLPVTMYNVDIYNQDISLTIIKKNQTSQEFKDPAFYFKEIINCKSFLEEYSSDKRSQFFVIGNEEDLITYLNVVTDPNDNYVMYFRHIIEDPDIQLHTLQSTTEFFVFEYENTNYCIKRDNNELIINYILSGDYALFIENDVVNFIYYETYLIDKTTFDAIETANSFIIIVKNYIRTLEAGDYDINTLVNDLNDSLIPTQVEITTTTSVAKIQAKVEFSSPNLFFINVLKGDLVKSLGFDIYPGSVENPITHTAWVIGENKFIFGSLYNNRTGRYYITSPGLVSLLGERFSVLRIKELEDHLYGSFSYMKMTPGVGMFKMVSTFGSLTNLRFDFTSVIRKPFHPIGRLSKLSFRFETPYGRLYDFKGVNHQLMVVIKFYVPSQKMKFTRSILNPNYDANLINYMAQHKSIQYHEKTTSDDESVDFEDYKKDIRKYDYSSSEEYSSE